MTAAISGCRCLEGRGWPAAGRGALRVLRQAFRPGLLLGLLLGGVEGLGAGPSVGLTWDRNPEADVVAYRVYVGLGPGGYTSALDVGNVTAAEVPVPFAGGIYHLAVTAIRADGFEGGFSDEVVAEVLVDGHSVPRIQLPALETLEDTPVPVPVAGLEGVAYVQMDPTLGVLSGPVAELHYNPGLNTYGRDHFEFYAVVDGAAVALLTGDIEVFPVNDAPVAQDASWSTRMNGAVEVTLEADDVDDLELTYHIATQPAHGTVTFDALPVLIYTPEPNFVGTDSFTFRASDGRLESEEATVRVVIEAVNQPPIGGNWTMEVTGDTSTPITLLGSDPEGGPVTFGILNPPTYGTMTGDPPEIVYTPTTGFAGEDFIRYAVLDQKFRVAVVKVTLIVVAPVEQSVHLSAQLIPNLGLLELTWPTVAGRRYALWRRSLGPGSVWTRVAERIVGDGSEAAWLVTLGEEPLGGLYQVEVLGE